MKFRMHSFYRPIDCGLETVLLDVPSGWSTILTEGFKEMFDSGWDGEIRQIKEKFGSLRLYLMRSDPKLNEIVNRMKEQTENVCSVCGKPATKTASDWVKHYCDEDFPA